MNAVLVTNRLVKSAFAYHDFGSSFGEGKGIVVYLTKFYGGPIQLYSDHLDIPVGNTNTVNNEKISMYEDVLELHTFV